MLPLLMINPFTAACASASSSASLLLLWHMLIRLKGLFREKKTCVCTSMLRQLPDCHHVLNCLNQPCFFVSLITHESEAERPCYCICMCLPRIHSMSVTLPCLLPSLIIGILTKASIFSDHICRDQLSRMPESMPAACATAACAEMTVCAFLM